MGKWLNYFSNCEDDLQKEINNTDDFGEDAFGFVYEIYFPDLFKSYIGRKNLCSVRKRNFGKKELARITDKRLKKYEMVKKESNWKTYKSSNDKVKELIKAGHRYHKMVIDVAFSKRELSYLEEKHLFSSEVLEDRNYLNDNIAGRYFRKDVIWEKS